MRPTVNPQHQVNIRAVPNPFPSSPQHARRPPMQLLHKERQKSKDLHKQDVERRLNSALGSGKTSQPGNKATASEPSVSRRPSKEPSAAKTAGPLNAGTLSKRAAAKSTTLATRQDTSGAGPAKRSKHEPIPNPKAARSVQEEEREDGEAGRPVPQAHSQSSVKVTNGDRQQTDARAKTDSPVISPWKDKSTASKTADSKEEASNSGPIPAQQIDIDPSCGHSSEDIAVAQQESQGRGIDQGLEKLPANGHMADEQGQPDHHPAIPKSFHVHGAQAMLSQRNLDTSKQDGFGEGGKPTNAVESVPTKALASKDGPADFDFGANFISLF